MIGGWIPGEGRRRESIGALLMGHFEDGRLRYAGRVGTGFTDRTLSQLTALLAPLRRDEPPFDPAPKLPRNAQFAAPELVAEVEFREWTSEGMMRAPSYKGLRDDRPAVEVVREDHPLAGGDEPRTTAEPTADTASAETVRRSPGPVRGGRTARRRALGTVDGRRLKLSNWDKVLFPRPGSPRAI